MDGHPWHARRPLLSAFTHLLTIVGTPALIVALGGFAKRVSRAVLLYRAGATALKHGSKDPRGKAGLKVVDALTSEDESWYRALMPWGKSGDSRP